jgi:hypothetical protein
VIGRSLFVVAGACFVVACAGSHTPIPSDWTSKTAAQKRALLDQLADNCHVTRDFFRLGDAELVLQPHPDEQYEDVDCALSALKHIRGLPKLGFVGNEYPAGQQK